jgi:hypothetical protein
MSEPRILIRSLRIYFPRNWEFGSALSKLQNFGGGGVLEPPNRPLGTPLLQGSFWYYSQNSNCIPSSLSSSNPNWSTLTTSSIFLSILLPSIFATIFAACAIRLVVLCSLHFVACGFFFKPIFVTSVKSLGYSPVSYVMLINVVIIFKPTSPNNLSTSPGTSSFPVAHLFVNSSIAFATSLFIHIH